MITFKQFLSEADHKQGINLGAAVELIKQNCKNAMKHVDTPLVRGMRGGADAFVLHGAAGNRSSANTTNHYTQIIDEVNGHEYPLRSKSMIFSNWANIDDAASYGNSVYMILPFDSADIGVCQDHDLWATRFKLGKSKEAIRIAEEGETFIRLMHRWGVPDFSYIGIVDHLEEILRDPEDEHYHEVIDYFTPGSVDEQLHQSFSARNLGMQLATPRNVYSISGSREMWSGDKLIAIHKDKWDEVKKELK